MRFPWQKDRNGNSKSQQAVLDAAESLRQAKARDPEVRAVSKTLKDMRERNHFAEQLHVILGGRSHA
jgi:hypothetical protein